MPVNMAQARALCSKAELQLVLESTVGRIGKLAARQLRVNMAKARKLRDKFRDLASGQRGEARGKRAPRSRRPAQGNANTVRKERLFGEALARFQRRLDRLEAEEATRIRGETRHGLKAGRKAVKRQRRTDRRAAKQTIAAASAATTTKKAKPANKKAKPANRAKPAPAGKKVVGKNNPKSVKPAKGSAPTAAGKKPPKKLGARSTARRAHDEATAGVRTRKTRQRSGLKTVRGHISSRGRRHQAKRDSR